MSRGLDDTRRSIRVDGMEDAEKRKLFNKFQEHGGEVLKEDPRKALTIDRDRQKDLAKRRAGASGIPEPAPPGARSAMATPAKNKSGSAIGRFFERFALWFKSTTAGVMEGTGGVLSQKFLHHLHSDAQARLLDLGLLVTPLAHPSAEFRPKLLAAMSKLGSVYFELIVRIDRLYDEKLLQELTSLYVPGAPKSITPRSVGEPLRELYKRIYILRSFSQSATTAIIRALELQAREEKKESVALSKNIQRAKRSLDYVFSELLPKLHLAVLNILKRNYWYGHRDLEEFLDLADEDRIGFITEKIARELAESKNRQQSLLEAKKTEMRDRTPSEIRTSDLPDQMQAGLAVMREFPTGKDKIVSGRENPLAFLDEDSKMYLTEVFFEILDREYSFILTSNKIKIALDYQAGERKDIRKLLNEGYFALDETRNHIKEYNRIVTERWKTERSPQYTPIQKSQMLHKSDMERTRLDNQTRSRFGNILVRIESALKMLVDDQKGANHFLQNPDEPVHFDVTGEGKRRLEGRTVIDAISETWVFVSALRFRLLEGDLSGLGSKIEQVIVYDAGAGVVADGAEPEETQTPSDPAADAAGTGAPEQGQA